MAIQTRTSRLAVKVETTEGTPVAPTASTDYLAVQDDLDFSPATELLENAEIKASLGNAKPILGLENPTGVVSHYLRGSGVEGQEPNYKEILQGVFGSVNVNATERTTDGSSTTSVVSLAAGGTDFQRGRAVLIKDGVNGYRIRGINDVATNDLELLFNVPVAPATGVNVGKCVTYEPADSGHQSLSLWKYVGNGGATELIAGAKAVSAEYSLEAGQLINGTYNFEGLSYYLNPIIIAATDIYLDFTDDGGTFAAVITAKAYKSPHELASALTTAMNSVQTAETHSVVYNDSGANAGKFTISTTTSTVLSLLWSSGANTANTVGDKLGFTVAADDTLATTYTSDNVQSYVSPQTPSFDVADPLVAKNNEIMIGDATDYICFEAQSVGWNFTNTNQALTSVCAESGRSGSIFNGRAVTISVTGYLTTHDVDAFNRYLNNSNVRFQYSFGAKTGGNWIPGKCGCLVNPAATITSHHIGDDNGIAILELELTAYVNDNGQGEAFLNFL